MARQLDLGKFLKLSSRKYNEADLEPASDDDDVESAPSEKRLKVEKRKGEH